MPFGSGGFGSGGFGSGGFSGGSGGSFPSAPWYFVSPWTYAFKSQISSYTVAPGSEQAVANLAAQTSASFFVKQFGVMLQVPAGTTSVTMTGENNFTPTNQITLGGALGTLASTLLTELASSDSPLFLYNQAAGTGYEVWEATPPGTTWTCGDGAQFSNFATGNGALPTPYGESASGLSYLATLISEGDAVFAEANGYFPHTIALIVSNETIKQWPPAVRYDGGASYLAQTPAEGMWFVMPSSVSMPGGMCTFAQWVFRTMQLYGVIITDRTGGGGVGLPTEYTPDWDAQGGPNPDPINVAFQSQSESTLLANIPMSSLVQIIPPVQGNPPGVIPAGATGLTVTAAAGALNVSWTTSSNVSNTYQTQVAYRLTGTGPNHWTLLSPAPTGGATTATIFGLTAGDSYDVQVWDQNVFGMAPSSIVTGTPNAAAWTSRQTRSAAATTLAFSSAVQAGNCLVAYFISTSAISAVSDTVNGAWGTAGVTGGKIAEEDDGTSVFLSAWFKANTAAGTPTVSATGFSGALILVQELTGIATSSPVDQITGNQGTGLSFTAGPTAALAAAGEPFIEWMWSQNPTATAGAGFTQDPSSTTTGVLGYLSAATTGGQTATGQTTTDSVWLMIGFALKL